MLVVQLEQVENYLKTQKLQAYQKPFKFLVEKEPFLTIKEFCDIKTVLNNFITLNNTLKAILDFKQSRNFR